MTEVKTLSRFFREYHENNPDSDLTERQLRVACATGKLRHARAGRLYLISEENFETWVNGGEADD